MSTSKVHIDLPSEASTERLGLRLGEECRAGDIICLDGDLGAGKTTLVQAVARGAGVSDREYVCSPTFALLHEYAGRMPIYHMDFYRVGSHQEIIELGLEDYFYKDGVVLVEWYLRVQDIIPPDFLGIQLEVTGTSSRSLSFFTTSLLWQNRIKNIMKYIR